MPLSSTFSIVPISRLATCWSRFGAVNCTRSPQPAGTSSTFGYDNVYVARTYAYVSAGKQGLALIDVEKPETPKLDQFFTADGQLNDVNDVKIGMVAGSAFAFVADGKNGLRVLQILSPWDDPAHFSGLSPRPTPKLIATARTKGPALAISKGIDRDRAVDESGNQLAVFGRRGARPLNREETQRLYLRNGKFYTVTDEPVERIQKQYTSGS
ncbi:MAG: hypothetical protein WAN12_07985 [Candidatus Acidiferrum sp.]